MTVSNNPSELFSPFLPSTFNVPEEEDRHNEWLGSTLSDFSDVVNDKVIGMYVENAENFNGNKFFYDVTSKLRNGYRFLVRIASFPNNTSITIQLPVVFTNQFIVSQVWGSASLPPTIPNTGDYFSFYSQGNSKVTFTMSDTVIVLTTTTNLSSYSGFIVVDYIKDGQ